MAKKENSKKISGSKALSLIGEKSRSSVVISKLKEKNIAEVADLAEKAVISHAKKHIGERIKNLHFIRRSIIMWLAIMVILVGAALVFRSVGQNGYRERGFTSGGVYSEGVLGEVSTLNPLFATTNAEKVFAEIAFLRLFDVDAGGKMNYEAVKNVVTDDNYKNFTVNLRGDIFWSDGKKFTADDVIFTINVLKNKTLFPQKYQIWQKVEINKTGDFSFRVSTPSGTSLILQSFDFSILPKHSFEGISIEKMRESDFEKKPVTSGAFSYKSTNRSENKTTLRLEKNAKFFQGSPNLDYFEIVGFSKKDDLKRALISGQISGTGELVDYDLSSSEQNKLEKRHSKLNKSVFAFLNTSSEILKEKELRRALLYGVDFEEIRKNMAGVSKMDYPIFEDFFDSSGVSKSDFSRSRAEEELDKLGWKKVGNVRQKGDKKLKINISTTDEYNLEKSASSLKTQLESLGVEVAVTVANKDDKTGAYIQSVVQSRSYDILMFEVDLGLDADLYPFWHSSQATLTGLNFSNYKDFVSDDLLFNYRNAESTESKREIMTKFVSRWQQEAPAFAIARVNSTYFYQKSAETYSSKKILALPLNRYGDVIYWKVNKTNLYKTQ